MLGTLKKGSVIVNENHKERKEHKILYYIYDKNEILLSSSKDRVIKPPLLNIKIPLSIFDYKPDYKHIEILTRTKKNPMFVAHKILDVFIDERNYKFSFISFYHIIINTTIEEL
jgi:hypothetical protein